VGPIASEVAWSACLSVSLCVCPLDIITSFTKTAEPIEMPFWGLDSGGPKELCIRQGPDPNRRRGILGGGHFDAIFQNTLTNCFAQGRLNQ